MRKRTIILSEKELDTIFRIGIGITTAAVLGWLLFIISYLRMIS